MADRVRAADEVGGDKQGKGYLPLSEEGQHLLQGLATALVEGDGYRPFLSFGRLLQFVHQRVQRHKAAASGKMLVDLLPQPCGCHLQCALARQVAAAVDDTVQHPYLGNGGMGYLVQFTSDAS